MSLEDRFPSLLTAAESTSSAGQGSFLRFTLAGLALGCLGAIGGAVNIDVTVGGRPIDLGALVAALAFAAAIAAATYVLTTRPQQRWYEGRAAAESVKTLAWQYSVAGGPFRLGAPADPVDLLTARLDDIVREMHTVDVPGAGFDQASAEMRQLRAEPLAERRRRYLDERVDAQIRWYSARAAQNETRVRQWFAVVVIGQSIGLVAGALKAFAILDVDVLGILGAVAASAAAWLQTKDHQNLAQSYAVTARELRIIRSRADRDPATTTEDDWADYVEESERAISREHTLWLARRASV